MRNAGGNLLGMTVGQRKENKETWLQDKEEHESTMVPWGAIVSGY